MTAQAATKQDLDVLFERMLNTFVTKEEAAQFVTKDYLKTVLKAYPTRGETEHMISSMVSEIVGDAYQMLSDRFDTVDERLDRIEDKLDRTAAIVDMHTVDIRQLKRNFA